MKETIKIKTSWNEVTLSEWLQIAEVESNKNLKKLVVQKSLKFVEILSNKTAEDINAMSRDMFLILLEKISFVINKEPLKRPRRPFKINKTNYIFHPNFDKLTTGEMVSIETIIKDSIENKRNYLPDILAVLIRPCIRKKNNETGKFKNTIEPFDLENLEFRKELFMDKLLVPEFYSHIELFMNGASRLKITTSLSSVRKDQLVRRIKNL